jgi:hypothetical protein
VHLGRSLTLLVLVVATAASCGGGEEAITPEDLPRIVLQANEAPPGTAKAAQVGGAQDLDAFARDAAEREALVADGFVQGYVVYFAPSEFFDPQVDVGPEAVSVQVIAGLFEESDGAASSLARFLDDLRNRQLSGSADVAPPTLGDEAFGLEGAAASDGSPMLLYAWRVENLILVTAASGPIDAADLEVAARIIDRRAST